MVNFSTNGILPVFDYLTFNELSLCHQVSRRWKQLASSSTPFLAILKNANISTKYREYFSIKISELIKSKSNHLLIHKTFKALSKQNIKNADRLLSTVQAIDEFKYQRARLRVKHPQSPLNDDEAFGLLHETGQNPVLANDSRELQAILGLEKRTELIQPDQIFDILRTAENTEKINCYKMLLYLNFPTDIFFNVSDLYDKIVTYQSPFAKFIKTIYDYFHFTNDREIFSSLLSLTDAKLPARYKPMVAFYTAMMRFGYRTDKITDDEAFELMRSVYNNKDALKLNRINALFTISSLVCHRRIRIYDPFHVQSFLLIIIKANDVDIRLKIRAILHINMLCQQGFLGTINSNLIIKNLTNIVSHSQTHPGDKIRAQFTLTKMWLEGHTNAIDHREAFNNFRTAFSSDYLYEHEKLHARLYFTIMNLKRKNTSISSNLEIAKTLFTIANHPQVTLLDQLTAKYYMAKMWFEQKHSLINATQASQLLLQNISQTNHPDPTIEIETFFLIAEMKFHDCTDCISVWQAAHLFKKVAKSDYAPKALRDKAHLRYGLTLLKKIKTKKFLRQAFAALSAVANDKTILQTIRMTAMLELSNMRYCNLTSQITIEKMVEYLLIVINNKESLPQDKVSAKLLFGIIIRDKLTVAYSDRVAVRLFNQVLQDDFALIQQKIQAQLYLAILRYELRTDKPTDDEAIAYFKKIEAHFLSAAKEKSTARIYQAFMKCKKRTDRLTAGETLNILRSSIEERIVSIALRKRAKKFLNELVEERRNRKRKKPA